MRESEHVEWRDVPQWTGENIKITIELRTC